MKRKIAAILAADVAGYAQRIACDEAGTVAQLAAAKTVFSKLITQHDGRVFNAAGDAILAEFSSAVEALRCALAVQKQVGPSDTGLRFRIGITIGDVVERNGDLFGDGVNIAARLQGVVVGGGICVSRGVYEQVGNRVAATYTDLGLRKLKNMPELVHAYGVVAGGSGASVLLQSTGSAASSGTALWIGVAAVLAIVAVLTWQVGPPGREPVAKSADQSPQQASGGAGSADAPPIPAPPNPMPPTPIGRSSVQCRDILERAQLGELSAGDRILLEQSCK